MSGYVYVISANTGDAEKITLKIGSTANDPIGRVTQLQTGCPHKLEIYDTYYFEDESYKEHEKKLHFQLSKHRVVGEWFSFDREAYYDYIGYSSALDDFRVVYRDDQGPITQRLVDVYERVREVVIEREKRHEFYKNKFAELVREGKL